MKNAVTTVTVYTHTLHLLKNKKKRGELNYE